MKKKIACLAVLLCCFGAVLNAQVEWKTIEQASRTEIKNNTKLFFIDFYTSWCGWCKKMDRETFQDPTVAKILNKYYIPVKFDAEGSSDFTWNGIRYSPRSNANARTATHPFAKAMLGAKMGFPSFGIFKSNESLLTILQGYQSDKDLVIILWYFASGDNNRYPFDKYQKIFDSTIRPVMDRKLGAE